MAGKDVNPLEKIRQIKELCEKLGINNVEIQADGGITPENLRMLTEKGLTVAVAGSAVFRAENPEKVITEMKKIN